MSLVINHNLASTAVSNTLNAHYANLGKSTQRLSTGLRINSAADDAAGLAIRELMRTDIAAMNQGLRNINDAISMLQTVDGALSIIDEKLIRMKELAEQAATGTYDSTQRLIIDSEFQQMASEINRIANATEFNTIKLLDGDFTRTPRNTTTETTTNPDGSTTTTTTTVTGPVNTVSTSTYTDTPSTPTYTNYFSATNITGASATATIASGDDLIGSSPTRSTRTISDNSTTTQPDADTTETVRTVVTETTETGTTTIEIKNSSVNYIGNTGVAARLDVRASSGTYTLPDSLGLRWNNSANHWEITTSGYVFDTDSLNPEKTDRVTYTSNPNIIRIDFNNTPSDTGGYFNDATVTIMIDTTLGTGDKSSIDGINFTVDLNPTPNSYTYTLSGAVTGSGTTSGTYNSADNTLSFNIDLGNGNFFNPVFNLSGANDAYTITTASATLEVTKTYQTTSVTTTTVTTTTTPAGGGGGGGGESGGGGGGGSSSSGDIPNDVVKIHFGSGNDSAEDYYYIDKHDATLKGLGLDGVSIQTQQTAQEALVTVNDAVVAKDKIRAYYGAMQNRLENTYSNISIQAENLQTAESRISDTDIAQEMTNFIRNQILTQSAVAMLAQANSLPQMALRLIS